MNDINTNNLIYFGGKVQIKRTSLFDSRKICSFNIEHPKFDEINISMKRAKVNKDKFVIDIKSKNNITMAKETLEIKPKEKEMYGIKICTFSKFRNNSLAEIIRLASIITMLENNIEVFKIFAMKNVETFHQKYKFLPAENNDMSLIKNVGIDMILTKEKIIQNKKFFNNLFEKHKIEYQI